MIAIVGDIGNTLTKICLINLKSFKIKKIIYLNTSKIYSKKYLKKKNMANSVVFGLLFKSVLGHCTGE